MFLVYKHGKPIYRFEKKTFAAILVSLLLAVGIILVLVSTRSNKPIKNNTKPLVTTVKQTEANTPINEKDFTLTLPGKWHLAAHNWDARYTSWQWKFDDQRYAGRLFEVYEDKLPTDYAYNYLLPLTSLGSTFELGQTSGNCTDFTTTAPTKNSAGNTISLAKWQQVSFYCDYGSTSQVVGTGSIEGINLVTLTGAGGTHKYFFIYRDNNISPDFGIMSTILGSFRAK